MPPPQRSGPLTSVLIGLLRKDPAERMDAETAQRLLRQALGAPGTAGAAAVDGDSAAGVTGTRALPTAPVPVRDRRPRRRLLLAVVAGVALLAALSLVLLNRDDRPNSTPPPGGGPPASQAVSPTAEASPTSSPAASQPPGFQLPDGWQMREDGTGFQVPVPEGWEFGRDEDGRPLWQDPATDRLPLIDQTREPKPDPVEDWQDNEQARRDGYDDYQRVRLEAVSYWDSAADWEFTYDLDGTPVHVLNRNVITAPDQAYSIYWRTPAGTWEQNRDELQIVLDGFVPARS